MAIEQLGGGRPSTGASLGTLVHAIAQEATDERADELLARVHERWGELEFETTWASEQAETKAADVTRRLAAYLRDVRAEAGRAGFIVGYNQAQSDPFTANDTEIDLYADEYAKRQEVSDDGS